MVIGISSLLFTNDMARQLREKEQNEVAIWAAAFRELGADPGNPLLLSIITTRNNIPFILTDGALRVEYSHLIPDYILNHPNLLRDKLDQMTKVNPHLKVQTLYNETLYIFFDESRLLKTLVYFPYIQLLVIIVFVVFGYITFRSTKQDEQNRVWIGLAKETAHQLGTPTSSLLGWLEYLKTQNIDQTAIDEMGKDIVRLTKVVDRFSKIGAATPLSEGVINEIVGNSVIYFRMGDRKSVEKRDGRFVGNRDDRRQTLQRRQLDLRRCPGQRQGDREGEFQTDLRTRFYDQNARLGARTFAQQTDYRRIPRR